MHIPLSKWVMNVVSTLGSDVRLSPERVTKSGHGGVEGQSHQLCPHTSDFNLLRYGKSIIDVDAEISNCALNLGMAEQKLNGSQISRAPVN